MRRHLVATAASIILTLLLGIGIAVAVEGGPKDDPASTESTESSGASASASDTESSGAVESTESESTESEADDADAAKAAGTQEHPENHGKYVSQAARDCPPGPEHGPCVSAVARSDAGKKPK